MTKLKGKDMEKWMKCYVGTNSLRGSKGIYTLEINTQNGEMREASTVEADDSAYLYVSEKRKCLYAVMESLEYKGVPGGGVAAYRIEDNKLSFLNSRYAYGGWPCHVIADEEKDSLLVSVFRNGLLVVYGINQDGSIGEERRVEHHQEPNGRMSHIHASMPTPDGKYIAVADCGLDYIYLYDAKTYQKVFEWKAPEDSGPRQLRFSPDGKYLYMVSELSCQIFVFEYQPDCKDMLRNVQVISTRREDGYDRENYTSALQMHPSGRYLLAGNRGHNSIVVYEVDKETGLLMLKGHTMLAGDFCREFCFVPDGSMLIVGIKHTDVVQTFFFDENKGILKWSGQEIVIPSPSCVIMGDSAK